eukprot:scaffold54412_cov55-Phaeocystis_antarctica.AAC.3
MRASALFLSSGELSQPSTASPNSCAYESSARRDGRLMRREWAGRWLGEAGRHRGSPPRRARGS